MNYSSPNIEPTAQTLSLEEQLGALQRGVGRLERIRVALELLADRISLQPSPTAATSAVSPAREDLVRRFADALGYAHNNLDSIEMFVDRIERALFVPAAQCPPTVAIAGAGRGR